MLNSTSTSFVLMSLGHEQPTSDTLPKPSFANSSSDGDGAVVSDWLLHWSYAGNISVSMVTAV